MPHDFSEMSMDQKIRAMVRSNNELDQMEAEISAMQYEVQRIPDEEGFRQRLAECEKMYVDVRVLFVEFKQQIRCQKPPQDEQALEVWRTWLETQDDLEQAIVEFFRWSDIFQFRALRMRERAYEVSSMALEEKRQALAGSDNRFATMRDALCRLRTAFRWMPPWVRKFWEQSVAECDQQFLQLLDRFGWLREEIWIQEARTSPLEDRYPSLRDRLRGCEG
jgi:hypothetical protein